MVNKQPYQGLVLITPSTSGDYVTDGKSYSQRLYVKPEQADEWRDISKADYEAQIKAQREDALTLRESGARSVPTPPAETNPQHKPKHKSK